MCNTRFIPCIPHLVRLAEFGAAISLRNGCRSVTPYDANRLFPDNHADFLPRAQQMRGRGWVPWQQHRGGHAS
jgi:hypothetical protein